VAASASDMLLVAPAHILLLMVSVLALIREYPKATSALAQAYLALLVNADSFDRPSSPPRRHRLEFRLASSHPINAPVRPQTGC